jgi:hypothetical protein
VKKIKRRSVRIGRASATNDDSRAMVASWTWTGTPHFASVCRIAANQCGRSTFIRQASTTDVGGGSCRLPVQELTAIAAASRSHLESMTAPRSACVTAAALSGA